MSAEATEGFVGKLLDLWIEIPKDSRPSCSSVLSSTSSGSQVTRRRHQPSSRILRCQLRYNESFFTVLISLLFTHSSLFPSIMHRTFKMI